MTRRVRLLVTGFCAPGFASIVHALRKSTRYDFYIFSTDWKYNIAAQFADSSEVIGDNLAQEWPDRILTAAEKERVEVLIPIRTDDLLPLAVNIGRLRDIGVTPMLPSLDPETIETLVNKAKLYSALKGIGLDVPEYKRVKTVEDLGEAISSLGYPDRPVCIKPSFADGSRGFRILDTSIDRRDMFYQGGSSKAYSDLDTIMETLDDQMPEMLVMEFLPGREYTVDILCNKGTTYAVLPRLRTEMTGGITTGATLARDEHYEFIKDFAERVVEGFELSYNIGIQLREDDKGNLKLLEMNPRLQGTTIISVEGGINIPELMVDMALQVFDPESLPEVKWGLKLNRIWRETFDLDGNLWTA